MKNTNYPLDDGKQIAAIELGNRLTADYSVVFIHGWLDNAASFIQVMRLMHTIKPNLHLVALDLPGHGLSSHKDPDNFYPFHDYIDDLYRFLHEIPATKRILVGHSLGALITSCYSAAFPEQVAALVQIEGVGPLAEEGQNATERLRRGVKSRERIRRKTSRSLANKEQAFGLRSISTGVEKDLIAPIVERDLRYDQIECSWFWRHDPKLKSDSLYRMTNEQAATLTGDIQCPHRIILGDQGVEYLKNIGGNEAITHTVSGAHHCHLESSDAVVKIILDLVNKI
ncbi:alpha/beta fold hydrolase [Vibrio tapetis]|uniref:Putative VALACYCLOVIR HYDROLASE n=1 Tax=Vibrio tapetis subsp. tapetis TaxID=1671868 RepID=A0A2N8ZDP8_9VIBR|nr:alpha/beta hydrolase [Vibrio tapetis]SON50041.1 putative VALACYCLOVIR HYDROLASE [Vibrio tapetis subsp. tapetis]